MFPRTDIAPDSQDAYAWANRARTIESQIPPDLMDLPEAILAERRKEFERIWSSFESAVNGRGRVVAISGDPGIGKTRLLNEFADRVTAAGAIVLRGEASAHEGMPPYLPFLEAMGQYIRTAPSEQLIEHAAAHVSVLGALFPELIARLGEPSTCYLLPTEQARLRLFEGVGMFLASLASTGPLVLMLDDLHYADPSSLDLLSYIAQHQSACRVLIVGTYQPGWAGLNPSLERAMTELNRRRLVTTIQLNPLSTEGIREMAEYYLGSPLAPAAVQLLHSSSEGNPFFAEELLRGWAETGAIVHDGVAWSLITRAERRLPSSIISTLRLRLSRVDSEITAQLRIASIVGRRFDAELLATIQGREIEDVEELLDQACDVQLIQPYRDGAYRFSHDMIRQCLYSEVSANRRRRLHELIGLTIERQQIRDPDHHLASLAFHFLRAGDRERSAAYSLQAGDRALRTFAAEQALAHYQTCLNLLDPSDERRGDVLLRFGDAALSTGDNIDAERAFDAARGWWLGRSNTHNAARATHGLGLSLLRQGNVVAAQHYLEQAYALIKDDSGPETISVLVDLAKLIGVKLGRIVDARALAEQALEHARQGGDPLSEGKASRLMGNLIVREGNLHHGIGLINEDLTLAREYRSLSEEAACCAALAEAYFWNADIEESRRVSLRRAEIAEQIQDAAHLEYVYSWLAYLQAAQGNWSGAERRIRQSHAVVSIREHIEPRAFLKQVQGYLALQQGELDVAIEHITAAVSMFREHEPTEYKLCLGTLALALARAGRRSESQARMTELELLLRSTPNSVYAGTILLCLGQTALELGDIERAQRYYSDLLAFEGQCHWWLVDLTLAKIEIAARNWEGAEGHLAAAERAARQAGLQIELARVMEAQAALASDRGASSAQNDIPKLLEFARDVYRLLGMADDALRVSAQIDAFAAQKAPAAPTTLPCGLTNREVSVLRLAAEGKSNRQIADLLFLSEKTVANHLTSIYTKTQTDNRAGAVVFALRHGLA